ncbi:MAG: N-6 DNA methylase, partial [Candidatus Aminicenantes bacterium]
MTKEQAIEELKELINLFEYNIKQYKGKNYDEAKARVDFIDKFFDLLDWDIYNKQGYSEKYRDVVREDRVTIKGKVKAPDYSFRVGGIRKFFVEAKKPAVDIQHEIEPAFQLRRYAYTAKLDLSILTDFEEFAVYDTRFPPNKNDKASSCRLYYCKYEEYIRNFDFLFNTFSKEAILKGNFDEYIKTTKIQKGTSPVDKEFLKLIEKWRENLAKNIALRNKNLSIYELNYVVQVIIDRIIFLRIGEDRQMEDYGRIKELTENKKTIYPELVKLFLQADVKYNSGLFDFKKDQVTPHLKIDDKILKDMIAHLYYPDSPYEFSVLDVEILGNIYEQFLGKTIRLTPAHQAKVEDKPEVKKAGGVYYTPKYIVDYIVEHTGGEKIKDKTPGEISKLKILDPACGSGSFLLGAYQLLMD